MKLESGFNEIGFSNFVYHSLYTEVRLVIDSRVSTLAGQTLTLDQWGIIICPMCKTMFVTVIFFKLPVIYRFDTNSALKFLICEKEQYTCNKRFVVYNANFFTTYLML